MAKTQSIRIQETLYEDASGAVYRAKDAGGNKVHLRKPAEVEGLPDVEQVAFQVAIERLSGIRHPSLHAVVSGGSDPEDSKPYVAIRPVDGTNLEDKLKSAPLSIELATALLSQALEVSELLSHLLADDGVWIETSLHSVLLCEKNQEPRFQFWPAPMKAMRTSPKKQSFHDLIQLTEEVLHWSGREVDERDGGHLQHWLKWLKDANGDVSVREARDMLAAAVGVEPPDAIEKLAEECRRKPSRMSKFPKMQELLKSPKPSMPLFAMLSVMLVLQAIIGWMIVRTINDNIDDELRRAGSFYTSTPYTTDREPNKDPEPGSQPLDF